jgi:hypothetical protein
MTNRAVVQPDTGVFPQMAADVLQAAAHATSVDDLFLRLEEAGIMLRIDRSVTPTMAKAPTLASWELEHLRTIEHVVRLGHIVRVEPGRLVLTRGTHSIEPGALIVHCAADGLRYPPLMPIWRPEAITLQPVRAGFPCFGAALIGYVEATRRDDAEKNRLCPPSPYPDTPADWVTMNVRGMRAMSSFGAQPDIKAWAGKVALNPARITPEHAGSPLAQEALSRLQTLLAPGVAALSALSGADPRLG